MKLCMKLCMKYKRDSLASTDCCLKAMDATKEECLLDATVKLSKKNRILNELYDI